MQIDMCRTDPSINMIRFYSVELTKDLFGHHGVHSQWGRFGAWGRYRHDWYMSQTKVERALSDLVKQKLARGHLLKPLPPEEDSQDHFEVLESEGANCFSPRAIAFAPSHSSLLDPEMAPAFVLLMY